MAEEPQIMSIQQRIAALNQAHVGRDSNCNPPFLRPQTATAPTPAPPVSQLAVAARNESASRRNNEAAGRPILPPPRPTTAPGSSNVAKSKAPPPLPVRKASSQQVPALPPRRPSARRNSHDSGTSDTSLSTTTTSTSAAGRTTGTSSTSPDACVNLIRAPAWGETELPPLPPKREQNKSAKSLGSSRRVSPPSLKVPPRPSLPPRRPSNNGLEENGHLAPRPPPRVPSRDSLRPMIPPRRPATSSGENDRLAPRLPPRMPSTGSLRPTLPRRTSNNDSEDNGHLASRLPARIPSKDNLKPSPSQIGEASPKLPIRKLPPPPPSVAITNKLRQSGFAALNRSVDTPEKFDMAADDQASNGVPPPVPLSSRPDLSKIQATKPRLYSSNSLSTGSGTICLKCRDYSSPDAHAARYPRESLPSYDPAWLANELTAPFPSLTDKARVLFTWLHHNISYDVHSFFNNCIKPSTPAGTLATGLAVCEGYAGLFAALATHAGLEAMVVSGHGKGFGFQELAPGSALPPFKGNHAWNVVKIDNGQWKLLDACWGAGVVQGARQSYVKQFNPAMFTETNDEFGMRHFPSNRNQFYRDDGRPGITWEEYLRPSPHPMIYTDAMDHSIGERTFQPATNRVSVYQAGPIRFQFGLICPHWTLAQHSKKNAGFFLLLVHGIDGRQDDRIPFNHFQGSGPGGGGDLWYVDITDPRVLGAPGQKLQVVALTSFGDRQDARGLSMQEFRQKNGRVGMAWVGIAEWELV